LSENPIAAEMGLFTMGALQVKLVILTGLPAQLFTVTALPKLPAPANVTGLVGVPSKLNVPPVAFVIVTPPLIATMRGAVKGVAHCRL